MQCLYCYNETIVNSKEGHFTLHDLFAFLEKRVGLLDAVVLSGGESTLHDMFYVCQTVKKMGYKIKIDTNGLNPKQLQEIIENNLVDYIALDYKAPHYKFQKITKSSQFDLFEHTLQTLINSSVAFEVRTTLHADLLTAEDINFIIEHLYELGYKNSYYLQHFLDTECNIGNITAAQNEFDSEQVKTNLLHVVYRN